jgi:protein tyrosine phosphatase
LKKCRTKEKYIPDPAFNCKMIFLLSSAGVGRTGVFLAIDTILDKLEKGAINYIDVFGQVCAMRERRMHMVQTLV